MSEYDTLEQESAILARFEALKNPNAKKVKKLAAKLHDEVTFDIQKRLCRDIYRAHDPLVYMRSCIEKIRDCSILIEQFIEDGAHGMIFTGKNGSTVYPVKLNTPGHWLKEDERWDPEQEMLIQHDAANAWMKEHDRGYFFGKVVLFPKFGFSGEPRVIEMECSSDTEGMKRYPGTNYFVNDKLENAKTMYAKIEKTAQQMAQERSYILEKAKPRQ
jgi:predicted transcriptional regulator